MVPDALSQFSNNGHQQTTHEYRYLMGNMTENFYID